MTMNHSTRTEARRFQELFARQGCEGFTPAELAELKRLERRHEAEQFCSAIYAATGFDLNLEDALSSVRDGLMMAGSDDAAERVQGLKLGLQACLDEPDALIAAVRVLLRNLDHAE